MTEHKPGDIYKEHDGPIPVRYVVVRLNSKKTSGMDLSLERLLTCAICGHQEWVKALSHTAKWVRSLAFWSLYYWYCPDHARYAGEIDRTLESEIKAKAEEIMLSIRERIIEESK